MKVRRTATWLLLLLPLCAAPQISCADKGQKQQQAEPFKRLSVEELDQKMKDAKAGKLALFVYDNNGKDRFKKSHIPGARWVQYDEVKAADLPKDKDATLVFYCANDH